MSDRMTFPDTVEEFMDTYKIVDRDGYYMSKETELVPVFRMKQWFEHLSTADVVPVVHARWIKPKGMMPPEYHGHYECSKCGAWAGRDWLRPWKEILLTNFCPNCGAKMDGEEGVR